MLEGFHRCSAYRIDRDIKLEPPRRILNRRKARLAHHAFQHDAAGNFHRNRRARLQCLLGFCVVRRVQFGGHLFGPEIIRKGDAINTGFAQHFQLRAALCDDMVFILLRQLILFCHDASFRWVRLNALL